MSRVITFSMPPEMAEQVRQLVQEEGRTMSELIREALRLYMDDREWRSLLRYGQRRAREMGISPEDVERLAPAGFLVDGHELVLYGKCPGCRGEGG